jgi:RsiW-degrading membrane proteinase PrsW (M82 family)
VNKLITYSEKNKDYNKPTIKKLKQLQDFLMVLLATILTIGFIIYFIEKKNEYGKKFDLITFLVGNEKCRNN